MNRQWQGATLFAGCQPPGASIMRTTPSDGPVCSHEVRYRSLFNEGRGLSFPCDAAGRVPLDQLSERARCNYFYARAVVGREFATPEVLPCGLH
jgi:hypothetical protein